MDQNRLEAQIEDFITLYNAGFAFAGFFVKFCLYG